MVNWKRTTFKQRLVRLLDRWSNKLRPKVHLVKADFEVTDISLVTHCPYCGTDDWDTPKLKRDGSMCDHPTRLQVIK